MSEVTKVTMLYFAAGGLAVIAMAYGVVVASLKEQGFM